MTGDLPPAALRLLSVLPVRTHERLFTARPKDDEPRKIGNARKVEVRGRRYASLSDAARALHTSRDAIRRMVYANKARYVA